MGHFSLLLSNLTLTVTNEPCSRYHQLIQITRLDYIGLGARFEGLHLIGFKNRPRVEENWRLDIKSSKAAAKIEP